MKTIIKIQSERKGDIELFFDLLDKSIVAKESDGEPFFAGGTYTSIFELDFKALQKIVTFKKNIKNVTKVVKQDNSKNVALSAVAGLYASNGMVMEKIAEKMNADGYTNSRGRKINKQQVFRLLKKYRKEEAKLLNRK